MLMSCKGNTESPLTQKHKNNKHQILAIIKM